MERWSNAPDFDPQEWSIATHPDRVSANARYFTIQPRSPYGPQTTNSSPGTPRTNPASNAPLLSTHVVRASELMGRKVLGETGETIGDVEDLIVDLSWGRIAQVIVSSGGFLGFNEELSAIPPVLFVQDPDPDHLALKANKALLSSAPRFNNGQWKNHASPEAVSKVYSAYGQQPYFDPAPDTDPTRLPVRDRVDPNLPGSIPGNSEADARLTENIRTAMDRDVSLSNSARQVVVVSFNGQVTLRGVVASEEEKQAIEKIARQTAGGDRVDSQLEVSRNLP